MKLVVIIPSLGRRSVLADTLRHLARQVRCPDAVVLSVTAPGDVPDIGELGPTLDIRTVMGPPGLAAQRNRALDSVLDEFDLVTFFDDDFLPRDDYLALVEQTFSRHAGYAVLHGLVIADGARGAGYSFDEGLERLRASESAGGDAPPRVTDHTGAYGCNMSFRAAQIGDLRFDERLVLYGWQEDIDFSAQFCSKGRIVSISSLVGVHLGAKGGRVNGTRLGYSQIVNPIYLVQKGTMPFGFAADLMLRNIAANLVKSLRPEPWIDRRGRLRGNLIAMKHVATGRIDPEYVLKL